MKVAVIIDTWFPVIGGGQINALEISKLIVKNGHTIDIITRNCGKDNLRLPKRLNVYKLGPLTDFNNPISKITFLLRSLLYLHKNDYDMIHAHAFLPGITARLLMITKSIPAIFTVHGTSINTKLLNPLTRRVEKFILTEILYSAQITVAQNFLNFENINKNIFYIPNGVDLKSFKRIKIQKSKEKLLIFVGRLHPQKNLINLIKAMDIVRQKLFVKLLIIGDGPQKNELRSFIKRQSLSNIIKLKGQVNQSQLKNLYSQSHIFILPSIYEGFPLTLLEAWSAKLPVITSKTGECQYLVKNGINGYLINNPDSPSDIAKVITKALENKDLEKLGLSGYNLIKSRFSWDQSAKQTLDIYESVIAAKN